MTNPRHHERVVKGTIVSEHIVQLYDDSDSLSDGLAEHLHTGWSGGHSLLVVARARHWAETAPKLEAAGCPVDEVIAAGRLMVLDAATTLASLMVDGAPDRRAFEEHIATLVNRLGSESPAGLTIYGEMVDILAEQADLQAAEELETLWNGLGESCSFRLLCGYASAHFSDERMAGHLQVICSAHTHARAAQTDLLASWLLAERRPRFHTDRELGK